MLSLYLIGETDEEGNLAIEERLPEPLRMVKVLWKTGDLDSGVVAVLEDVGDPYVASALGVEAGSLDEEVLAIPNANTDGLHETDELVNHSIRLRITGGGANKRGGAIVYFDNASAKSQVEGSVSVEGGVTVTGITQPTAPRNGRVLVTTAGTQVQLPTMTLLESVTIKAALDNVGIIYVGDADVSAANGFELAAGHEKTYVIDNCNRLWVDASVNGQSITFAGS